MFSQDEASVHDIIASLTAAAVGLTLQRVVAAIDREFSTPDNVPMRTVTDQLESRLDQIRAISQKGTSVKRGPGRPRGPVRSPRVLFDARATERAEPVTVKAQRKTRAKILCPVPGCQNVAAPIFGMVCKEHKAVAKSKIAKFRDQARKLKASGNNGKKPGTGKVHKKS
jgi:hypothetical protein